MDDSIFRKWTSLEGRIGRKEYWLYYMLPTGVFTLLTLGLLELGANQPDYEQMFMLIVRGSGLATLWFFTLGNVKRIRDLKLSGVAVMGLWWTVMVVAMVIAAGLFIGAFVQLGVYGITFTNLDLLGVGGDVEGMLIAAGIVFFTPIGVLLLVAGFVPNSSSKPMSKSLKMTLGGFVLLIVGLLGHQLWEFDTNQEPAKQKPVFQESALIQAVRSNQLEEVLSLLSGGSNPNQQTQHGTTALILAIERLSLEIAIALVEHGAEVSMRSLDVREASILFDRYDTKKGMTMRVPLVRASASGDLQLVELMLERGAKVNPEKLSRKEPTPLKAAALVGHTDIVKLLLSHDALVKNNLSWAVYSKNIETVEAFLEHGEKLNVLSMFGTTPLMEAVKLSSKSRSKERVKMVRFLLKRGADPHLQTREGVSPLMWLEQQAETLSENENYQATLSLLREAK